MASRKRGRSLTVDRVSASRRVAASPQQIFAIVSNPKGHVEIDGSGMIQVASDPRPLTSVGETFDMEMDRRPLGDVPEMTEYEVRCTVTRVVADRLFEWDVSFEGFRVGHVFGWQIDAVSASECEVTNYCDWTMIGEETRARRQWPIIPIEMLEHSVERLEALVTSAKGPKPSTLT
jgi:hypothetical protein